MYRLLMDATVVLHFQLLGHTAEGVPVVRLFYEGDYAEDILDIEHIWA